MNLLIDTIIYDGNSIARVNVTRSDCCFSSFLITIKEINGLSQSAGRCQSLNV